MRLAYLSPVIAALAAMQLAACTPADAVLDGNLQLKGMEPAVWLVRIDREANTSTVSIFGEADFKGTAPVKAPTEEGGFTLTSKTPEGDFVMRLTQEDCLDGLDNNVKYEWSVNVDWKGETLIGCARPA